MQLSVRTELLRDALNKVLSVVDKKNSRPILTYTLIVAKNNSLQLLATDLEVSAKVEIEATVNSESEFCVNAKNLFDILKELPDTEVNIEIDDSENILKLYCNDIFYSLLICNSNDFPQLIFENEEKPLIINTDQLLEVINRTSFAISLDETRPQLNGIYLHQIESKLRVVATDGHRLALIDKEMPASEMDTLINGIIIPKKGVYELKKLTETYPDTEIKIYADDSFIYVNAEDKYFLSVRLIAREYLKYQAAIPTKTSFKMNVEKELFLNAVKRIKIMSNEKSNGIKITLYENEMIVAANHPSLGDAIEKVPISYNGKEMEIGFNAKYLIDTLSSFEEGEVSLELNNELSPVLVKSYNLPHFLGILMPLRIQ